MKPVSYSNTIIATATSDEVYKAVSRDIHEWWGGVEGFEKPGDVATITFPPSRTFWTLQAKTLKPGELVELECIDAHHIPEGASDSIRTEWLGTTLAWRGFRGGEVVHTSLGFLWDRFELLNGVSPTAW